MTVEISQGGQGDKEEEEGGVVCVWTSLKPIHHPTTWDLTDWTELSWGENPEIKGEGKEIHIQC